MAQPTVAVGQPMGYGDFLELEPELRAEYVDGEALMAPPPSFVHQKICQRITRMLEDGVPAGAEVVAAAGWVLAQGELVRIPDVMVLRQAPAGPLVLDTPVAVVEVLSTNRADDLVRTSHEYLRAGVEQYWVADPRDQVLDVYANREGWHRLLHLDAAQPRGSVDVLGATITVDISRILG